MWARKIDWKFCCRRNYCSYFFFFRVTEFINVSSYAIYAAYIYNVIFQYRSSMESKWYFTRSLIIQMRTSCHRCALYSSIPIVNLPLINHTVSTSPLQWLLHVDCVFSTLNFAPISCDTIYLLSHLRIYSCCIWTKDGFFPGNAYYVYPEIATFVRNLG